MKLLDLYSGGAIGADGYAEVGMDVTCLDIAPQPNVPYFFIQADALHVLEHWDGGFDAIHASPPCQAHTRAQHLRTAQGKRSRYQDLLTPTLDLLAGIGTPWVVENVPGTESIMRRYGEPFLLCGSMFGLKVQRHRWFLSNRLILTPGPCDHSTFEADPVSGKPRPWGVYYAPGDDIPKGGRTCRDIVHARECMGVEREVSWAELKESIPPAYTRWIGAQLLAHLGVTA